MLLLGKVTKVGKVGKAVRGGKAQAGRAGQAALEFLLNYGWAILGVLVVLGGLARFGVLSPANLVPEKCSFPGSVGCPDFEVGSNGIKLVLQNRAGKDIVVSGVSFGSDALSQSSGACSTGAMSAVVNNGAKATFYANDPINCNFKDTGRPKNKYNVTVTYSFLGSTGISHSLSGELLARKGEVAISGGAGEFGGNSDPALVGYWRFDEGTGQYVTNAANGEVGFLGLDANVAANDPTWTNDGVGGYALSFNGSAVPGSNTQHVNMSGSGNITSNLTIAAWIKVYDNVYTKPIVLRGNAMLNGMAYAFYVDSAERLGFSLTGPTGIDSTLGGAAFSVSTGVWHHVAAVYLPSVRQEIYIDGALIGTKTAGVPASLLIPIGSTNLYVGWQANNDGFKGTIDEVGIWNRSLSAQEIAALAAQ